MAEQYVETIIIRQDNRPDVSIPSFDDVDVDATFKFEGTLKLIQILKSIQNMQHNKHDYVFKIEAIDEMEKEE